MDTPLSHIAGLNYMIGAFLAGLLPGDLIRVDRQFFDSLTDSAFGFFITLFFASVFPPRTCPLLMRNFTISVNSTIPVRCPC